MTRARGAGRAKQRGATAPYIFRRGQMLDKYRIERRIAVGPFAAIYQAFDTIEGTRVALKIPHAHLADESFLADFRREVQLSARLDHRAILPLKNAGFIREHFVIASPLGDQTLGDRMASRISQRTKLELAEQALEAVAHAHGAGIIHCDIKPENFILFPDHRLRLGDFGISKIVQRRMTASGSGTIGYVAPEQAMGRPTYASDVFSLGLVLYRMFSGVLPEWPYEWPPPGYLRLRGRLHPDLIKFLRRALEVKPSRRFRDGEQMLAEFRRIKARALRYAARARTRRTTNRSGPDWQAVRLKQFQRQFGRVLETRYQCRRCGSPVSEAMRHCPWCGTGRKIHSDETTFPKRCPRCKRGIKLDWRFCPWCYGAGMRNVAEREYSDRRYQARCTNRGCTRKVLMPFMRYCPWCRRAVQRKWPIPGSDERCPSCKGGVVGTFWSHCPWCGKRLRQR
jgi:serine/threonine-protein kinase